jgi:hypothetical protein
MAGPTPLTPEERFVQRWLEQIGITAEKVAEDATGSSCDFRATDAASLYWIEVKSRTGDQTVAPELQDKGIAYRMRPTGYAPTMAAIFDEAAAQLASLSDKEPGFEVIFVPCTHPAEGRLAFEQVAATAFGSHDVIDLEDLAAGAKWCFFFGESTFYKHKRLDAIVTLDAPSGRFTMCVNPYSPRRAAFGESSLYRAFQKVADEHGVDAILDPAAFEKSGRSYWADCTISRRDEETVLEYVKKKYGLKRPKNFVLQEHSAYAVVDKKSPE